VAEPTLTITEVVQDIQKKELWIHGTTTWGEGTAITIRLDPDQFALKRDIREHTWASFAVGNISQEREFDAVINYEERELAIGPHEITATIDKNHLTTIAYHTFLVSDILVMPTPTPSTKRILLNAEAKPMTTRIYAPAPIEIAPTATAPQSPVEPIVLSTGASKVDVLEERTITPSNPVETPLAAVTTAPVIVTPTATRDPNIHVPLPWWIAVAAVGIAVWRRS
jgi:hypothetical protein